MYLKTRSAEYIHARIERELDLGENNTMRVPSNSSESQVVRDYWATHDRNTANFNSGRSNLNGSRLATSIATFRDYESRDLLHRTSDPLEWWKQNRNHALLKNLIPTVKKWMCVPATSVPSERVFSTMGELISERRNRLSPRMVSMVMFLNKNLD